MWFIHDGASEIGTGCGESDAAGAERALALYVAKKITAPGALPLAHLYIDDVLASWLAEYVPYSPSEDWLQHTARPVNEWWRGKPLSQINGANCRAYLTWHTEQFRKQHPKSTKPKVRISEQTARHELKTLRAAIRWYHAEHGPLASIPTVTMPSRTPQKTDYWLTRKEVADRTRAARRNPLSRHIARVL
jgi:hypothetical protein